MQNGLDGHDGIIFDLDDTLIDWTGTNRRAFDAMVERYFVPAGVPARRAGVLYRRVLAENFAAFRQDGRWWYPEDRVGRLAQLAHAYVPIVKAAGFMTEHAMENLRFLDGAKQLLGACKDAGMRVGLLTNGPADTQRAKYDALGIDHWFDFAGISGELDAWKPDPAAFYAVLEQLGVAPQDCVMVGDNLEYDLEPAQVLGMTTVWMRPDGPVPDWVDHAVDAPRALLGA